MTTQQYPKKYSAKGIAAVKEYYNYLHKNFPKGSFRSFEERLNEHGGDIAELLKEMKISFEDMINDQNWDQKDSNTEVLEHSMGKHPTEYLFTIIFHSSIDEVVISALKLLQKRLCECTIEEEINNLFYTIIVNHLKEETVPISIDEVILSFNAIVKKHRTIVPWIIYLLPRIIEWNELWRATPVILAIKEHQIKEYNKKN